ncbi:MULTISPECIES: hypothetical protein [Alphaproteobacteria]|uniref:hypothetical protein n=1 Tax=Alphaproteobacteria TaxID=28211 RepID=UPI000DEF4E3C|nr:MULTISPECIES: hypothetical protein [Alphaproteobacteria]
MADLKKVQPNQWPDFTPPRSAQCRRSTGWFCHRHAQGRAVLAVTLLSNEAFDPARDAQVIAELRDVCGDITLALGGSPPKP